MKVIEVSPVMLGAGVNTHTVDIKALKGALEGEGKEEALQELHDLLVSLGAKCSEPDGGGNQDRQDDGKSKGEAKDEGGNAKSSGKPRGFRPSILAVRAIFGL